jgi:mannose-6-phosphate isomerase-like protein (cupin superfamily)
MDIFSAKEESKIFVDRGLAEVLPSWSDFESLFDAAQEKESVSWSSFATFNVDNAEALTEVFDDLLSMANERHPGDLIAVLAITHFENSVNNSIPAEADNFYQKFTSSNPQKKPRDFTPTMMSATIHSDPVDGMFFQCVGETLWTAYYGEVEESWTIRPGDMVYIPSGVVHSVKSLMPRCSISIGFNY